LVRFRMIERVRAKFRGQEQGKEFYFCANTDLHPHQEIVQVLTTERNPKCPYCGYVMIYGRYW